MSWSSGLVGKVGCVWSIMGLSVRCALGERVRTVLVVFFLYRILKDQDEAIKAPL